MRRRDFIALLGWSALERPFPAQAQPSHVPLIGYLSSGEANERVPLTKAFREGLGELGFVEGQNVAIEYRWAEGRYDKLPALAADLVSRHVAVIAASDAPSAMAAKAATKTIPVAFQTGADAVQSGLVKSLDHPEANLTGINEIAGPLATKRLGLLHDLVPGARKIAFLVNPGNANAVLDLMAAGDAARQLGLQIEAIKASSEAELLANFSDRSSNQIDGLVVNPDIFLYAHRELVLSFCEHKALPSIFPFREYVAAGGLMSYGISLPSVYRQVGRYTAELLKGAKPGDLPVAQPTKFEFVINLKTAKSRGITFPPGLIAIADEVLE